jgi:hypothetical protein
MDLKRQTRRLLVNAGVRPSTGGDAVTVMTRRRDEAGPDRQSTPLFSGTDLASPKLRMVRGGRRSRQVVLAILSACVV